MDPGLRILKELQEVVMNHLNSVLIEGNLVRDPEVGYSPKGTALCSFSVASNRFYKQGDEFQREVSYFDVTVWSRLAEVCGEYLKKGRGVRLTGRLKQDRWIGTDGKSRSRVFILAEHEWWSGLFYCILISLYLLVDCLVLAHG